MKGLAQYFYLESIQVIRLQDWIKPYPLHNHVSVTTVGLVISGAVALTLNCQEERIAAGHVFVVPPYSPHSLRPLGAFDMVSLCVPKSLMKSDKTRLENTIKFTVKSLRRNNILRTEEEYVLYRSLENYELRQSASLGIDETGFVAHVRDFLESAPETQIKASRLAEKVSVCEGHMIREFKKKLGLTPHYFQIQNRVRRAQKLLERGVRISEAALAVGFYDQSHFVKYFRHFLGMPPSDYVKACQGSDENFIK
jgi:AraC-like DNA-binding protein